MKTLICLAAAAALSLAPGCRVYHDESVECEPVCEHLHGPGCGHPFVNGVWIVPEPVIVVEPPSPSPLLILGHILLGIAIHHSIENHLHPDR